MDIDHAQGAASARDDLIRALNEDLGDYFSFTITGTEDVREGVISLAVRYRVDCVVAGTLFEPLQIDVTVVSPTEWAVEPARRSGLLAEVGLGPIDVLLVPLERQIAEKLHAYTRKYNGGSTRVKDLVDFVLISSLEENIDARRLSEAVKHTFERRDTHPVPDRLPPPPGDWERSYRQEATEVGITENLQEAYQLVAAWLDPVLQGTALGAWNHKRRQWSENRADSA
jgi:hypothetical protein